MNKFNINTKYQIDFTSKFKKQLRKIIKQGKDISDLLEVVTKIANLEKLDVKYEDHELINDNIYHNCRECHIKPNWLLIYKYLDNETVFLLYATGSHNELFKNKY